jgi:hypothetical protein
MSIQRGMFQLSITGTHDKEYSNVGQFLYAYIIYFYLLESRV